MHWHITLPQYLDRNWGCVCGKPQFLRDFGFKVHISSPDGTPAKSANLLEIIVKAKNTGSQSKAQCGHLQTLTKFQMPSVSVSYRWKLGKDK